MRHHLVVVLLSALLVVMIDAAFSCTTTAGNTPYVGRTSVFGWGSNARMQISLQPTVDALPVKITMGSRSVNVTRIVGGMLHTGILDAVSNRVWLNGEADSGQLGTGPMRSPYRNALLPPAFVIDNVEPIAFTRPVFSAACGTRFTCIITTSGNATQQLSTSVVYCCGSNSKGQLGQSLASTEVSTYLRPVPAATSLSLVSITAGSDHVAAVTSQGAVWCWGSNGDGSLGNAQTIDSSTPVQVVGIPDAVAQVQCGIHFCVALTAGGALYGWGLNDQFQLGGASNSTVQSTAVRIIASGVTMFACGGAHVLAVVNRRLHSWGSGTMGATAQPKPYPSGDERWFVKQPTLLTAFADVNVASIACGAKHSVVLDTCGTVYSFGSNAQGQLGVGQDATHRRQLKFRSMSPVKVTTFSDRGIKVVAVYAAWFNSYAVTVETIR